MKKKQCSGCHLELPLNMYHKNKEGRFGRQSRCKTCRKESCRRSRAITAPEGSHARQARREVTAKRYRRALKGLTSGARWRRSAAGRASRAKTRAKIIPKERAAQIFDDYIKTSFWGDEPEPEMTPEVARAWKEELHRRMTAVRAQKTEAGA